MTQISFKTGVRQAFTWIGLITGLPLGLSICFWYDILARLSLSQTWNHALSVGVRETLHLARLNEPKQRKGYAYATKASKGASIYDVRTEGGRGYLQKQTYKATLVREVA